MIDSPIIRLPLVAKLSFSLLIISIIGTYIGKKILNKISEKQFKSLVLILVLITGLISLIKVFSKQ